MTILKSFEICFHGKQKGDDGRRTYSVKEGRGGSKTIARLYICGSNSVERGHLMMKDREGEAARGGLELVRSTVEGTDLIRT
jgi:hypothetical protein